VKLLERIFWATSNARDTDYCHRFSRCLSVSISVRLSVTNALNDPDFATLCGVIGGGACSVRRVPRARGHSVQPSPNAFGLLLYFCTPCMKDASCQCARNVERMFEEQQHTLPKTATSVLTAELTSSDMLPQRRISATGSTRSSMFYRVVCSLYWQTSTSAASSDC